MQLLIRKAHFEKNLLAVFLFTFITSLFLPAETIADEENQMSSSEVWENLGRLYKNKDNPLLQELWLLGRYHGQYHWSEGSSGNDDGYETRRFRLGAQAKAFDKLTLHAQMVSGSDVNPFYGGFTELWAQWAFSPEFALTLGQQKHRFTHDRNVSSRYLNYLERNMLTNMFRADYTPAMTAQGRTKHFNYYTGLFSNATGKNMGDAFTELDSGYSFLAAGYYDIKELLPFDQATLGVSYLHSDANNNATNLNRFRDGLSSALILTEGSSSLVSEVTAGFHDELGHAYGISLQPGYFLTNELQAVARYQFASSNKEDGLSGQLRYEQEAGILPGDLYQAGYLGLNYYIAEHRLKLMQGIEYAKLDSQDVWTTSFMFRFFFGPHSGGAFPMDAMLPGHFEDYD